MKKIYCEEQTKKKLDTLTFDELREMIGWIEPSGKNGNKWTVTMNDGSCFDCATQEIAQLLASMEEIKAMLLRK